MKIAAALLALLLLAAALSADTLLTKKRDEDDFSFENRSSGGKNQKVQIWIGADRVRRDNGKTGQILRLDQNKLYLLDHTRRTYTALDLAGSGDRLSVVKEKVAFEMPEEAQAVWRFRAEARPTGATRKVGSWQAQQYDVALKSEANSRNRLDWWVAPELKIQDAPLRTLKKLLASLRPQGDRYLDDLAALPGWPVLVEKIEPQPDSEIKTREELLSIEEKKAPEGTYDLPSGYKQIGRQEFQETTGLPVVL